MLANAYGHEIGIAEYVIGAILALTRDFIRLDRALRQGDWQSQWAVGAAPPPVWPELAGKTIGILGYGRIGQAVARRAGAFDMEVCASRQSSAYRPATIWPCSVVRTPSTKCCGAAITLSSRYRQRRRQSVGLDAGSSV